jgi:hypothetical protein
MFAQLLKLAHLIARPYPAGGSPLYTFRLYVLACVPFSFDVCGHLYRNSMARYLWGLALCTYH